MMALRYRQLLVAVLALGLSGCAAVSPLPPEGAIEVGPPESRLQQGLRRYQEEAARLQGQGRLRESLERWKVVLTIDPQHQEARQRQKELEGRIQEGVHAHIAAGKEQLQRRDKQAAQREFLAVLRLDPGKREALELLYQSEAQLGQQTAFARPLKKDGTQGSVQSGDLSKSKQARMGEAEDEAEEESGEEEVSFAEAAEVFRKGDYLAAIDAFSRVLAQQPGMREAVEYQKLAYYNQGVAYITGERYAEALKMFEQVKKMQPDFKRLAHYIQTAREKLAEQHNLAGIRHYKEQKLKEAIEEWDQALTLNPKLETARRSQEKAKKLLKNLEEMK